MNRSAFFSILLIFASSGYLMAADVTDALEKNNAPGSGSVLPTKNIGSMNNYLGHFKLSLKTKNEYKLRGANTDVKMLVYKMKQNNQQQWVVDTDFTALEFIMTQADDYSLATDSFLITTNRKKTNDAQGEAYTGFDVGRYSIVVKCPVKKGNTEAIAAFTLEFEVPLIPAQGEQDEQRGCPPAPPLTQ